MKYCEWKKDELGECVTSCCDYGYKFCLMEAQLRNWKYCPNCGRKIKVVK
jgi:hypothetical protein